MYDAIGLHGMEWEKQFYDACVLKR
jgi:hypothetical protein